MAGIQFSDIRNIEISDNIIEISFLHILYRNRRNVLPDEFPVTAVYQRG
jgi:hypothetical protein